MFEPRPFNMNRADTSLLVFLFLTHFAVALMAIVEMTLLACNPVCARRRDD
jgi:hypothetical protein